MMLPMRTILTASPLPAVAASLILTTGLCGCGDSDAARDHPGQDLIELAEHGDVLALDVLLQRTGEPDVRDSCHWTPLMKAALNGHLPAVRRLLEAGAEVDAVDKGGYTAMMLAASNNHADVVSTLLDHGAMIDHQEMTQGLTALTWASKLGHQRSVDVLLARGADASLPDFSGQTASDWARRRDADPPTAAQ